MTELNKLRFVVGMWGDSFWSASFHDYHSFLTRQAEKSGFDMDEEPGFKRLKGRPKWLYVMVGDKDLWSCRDLPRGGYIEPLDWDENDFREHLDEMNQWHANLIKVAA